MHNVSSTSRVWRSLRALRSRGQKNGRNDVVHSIKSCAYEDLPVASKNERHADLHVGEKHELEADALPGVSEDEGLTEHPATDTSHAYVFTYLSNAAALAMDASRDNLLGDRNRAEPPAPDKPLDNGPENYRLAAYPATDTFYDELIARWPAITCSELGSTRIRLVKISPGPPGSTIEFKVNICFLAQAPGYAAVSYTWGSSLGFREILIEGRPYSVPKNLWRFLDQARKLVDEKHLAGWLWIDALSIDQSNPREKLDQVGIISSIFGKSERVIVWLGPPYDNSDLALAAICPDNATRSRREPKTLAGPVWSGVHGLCERPYWRRLWVYQELRSAQYPHLMCGNKLVPLRDFQEYLFDTAAHRLEDKLETLRGSSAGKMLSLVREPAKTSLWSLIQKTRHLRCTDPRDKAYAIHNIARTDHHVHLRIQADYTVTVPVLLNRILENACATEPPTSLRKAAKLCMEIERLFGQPLNSIFVIKDLVQFSQHMSPLEQLSSGGKHPDLRLQELLSAWCHSYSQFLILQLVYPPRKQRGTTRY
jgi:hypothetical protein